jgi:hypothetical protein
MAIDEAPVHTWCPIWLNTNNTETSVHIPRCLVSISGIKLAMRVNQYAATKQPYWDMLEPCPINTPKHGFRVVSPGFIRTDALLKMPLLVRTVASDV